MDHFRPREFKERGLRVSNPVPWLGFADHDIDTDRSVPFRDYPQSRGWNSGTLCDIGDLDITTIRDKSGQQPLLKELLAFLQAWLYFGFLEAIVHRRLDISGFIKHSEIESTGLDDVPDKFLFTESLEPIFREWEWEVEREDSDAAKKQFDQLFSDLIVLIDLWRRLNSNENFCGLVPTSFFAILRSVAILNVTVCHALKEVYEGSEPIRATFTIGMASLFFKGGVYEDLYPRLIEKGYCPSKINIATDAAPWLLLEYMNARNFTILQNERHENCTPRECTLYDIDPDMMQPRNCRCGLDCPRVRPFLGDIVNALDEGYIPAVEYYEASGQLSLKVVPIQKHDEYVAFSHVWADGLGSVTEEGLFSCQLKRLSSLAKGLPFWMDSLCIPKRRDARRKSIQLMSTIYENASCVVVLDRVIRETSTVDVTRLDLRMRVLLSGWNYRLWTLQEAMLAKKLLFEVSDGLVLYPTLDDRETTQTKFEWRLEILLHLSLGLGNSRRRRMNLGQAMNMLKTRHTTKPNDETLAIAPLLGVDTTELLDASETERMPWLLAKSREIPLYTAYIEGERCEKRYFGWAPRSFMSFTDLNLAQFAESTAICTEVGLFATYEMVVFQTALSLRQEYYFKLNEDLIFHVYGTAVQSEPTRVEYNAILYKSGNFVLPAIAGWVNGSAWCFDEKSDDLGYWIEYGDDSESAADKWINCIFVSVIQANLSSHKLENKKGKDLITINFFQCEDKVHLI